MWLQRTWWLWGRGRDGGFLSDPEGASRRSQTCSSGAAHWDLCPGGRTKARDTQALQADLRPGSSGIAWYLRARPGRRAGKRRVKPRGLGAQGCEAGGRAGGGGEPQARGRDWLGHMPGGSCGRMAAQTSWTRLAPPPRRRWRPRGTCRRLPGDSSAPAPAPNPRPRLAGGGDCLSRGLSTTVTASPPAPPTRAARAGAHQPASTSPPTGLKVSRGPSAGQAAGPVEPSG